MHSLPAEPLNGIYINPGQSAVTDAGLLRPRKHSPPRISETHCRELLLGKLGWIMDMHEDKYSLDMLQTSNLAAGSPY